MICPACRFDNLSGVDSCIQCGTSLTQEDTSPRWKEEECAHILGDPIWKVSFRDPVIVKPNASVLDVISKMRENKVGCSLIVDQGHLLGIFTERDVLERISLPELQLHKIEVQDIMTPTPEVLQETDTVSHALNKMAVGRFRHIPVQRKDGSYTSFAGVDMLRHLF